ncbi:cytochrome P450 [Arthrobacter sp. Sa2BUA2]|uniref:Cytochrome P450 n=1 Tax=Arthrobacter pullicola TaxID=2762224 RepID=A0ABR8YET7_9MICC|nr:cytochrome P450 [Arthrobacter pullicola]MBD8042718.1 cytochrome P450 [Arthrobacter pullicola]
MTTTTEFEIPVLDLDPFADDFLADPYEAHVQLRESGPVTWLNRYQVWAVARHDEVSQVFADHETFISSAGVGITDFRKDKPWRAPSLLLEADPPEHTRARHVVTSILNPKFLRELKAGFQERAEHVAERVAALGDIDGVKDLAEAYPLEVFPDFVGLPKEGRENLLPYGSMVFNTFGPRNGHFEKAMEKGSQAAGWVMEQCQPGALQGDGLGNRIHAAAAEAGYAAEDSARLLRSFLSAGVDTTVHGIGNALLCLAQHPEQYRLLHHDPSLARAAFEETIRYESPVQTFFRTTSRETELSGTRIPEGAKILMFIAAANRDPRRWENPEDFDITRKTMGHVGFGFGIHACLGQMLARLEGECILSALARRVQKIEIIGAPVQQLNNTLRGLDSLPLRLTPSA